MRRVARHVFTLCSALSLLLGVVACVLWVRSYRHVDVIGWKPEYEVCSLQSYRGHFFFFANPRGGGDPGEPDWFGYKSFPVEDADDYYDVIQSFAPWQPAAGFSYTHLQSGLRILVAPCWPVAAAAMLLQVTWLAGWVKRHTHARRGRCPTCGYDLRATPERCPECGAGRSSTAVTGPRA